MDVKPTFLTVMFVLMQYKTVAALTNVRADRVDALVLAAAVVLAALILVCERHTCNTSLVWGGSVGWGGVRGGAIRREGNTEGNIPEIRCRRANVLARRTAAYLPLRLPERVKIKRERGNMPQRTVGRPPPWWQVAE